MISQVDADLSILPVSHLPQHRAVPCPWHYGDALPSPVAGGAGLVLLWLCGGTPALRGFPGSLWGSGQLRLCHGKIVRFRSQTPGLKMEHTCSNFQL